MSKEVRSEQVGAKVTPFIKQRIETYKKETGKSLGDVIEIVYMNFSGTIDEILLFKVENMEEQIDLLTSFAEKTQKITEETLSIIKTKQDKLNKTRRQIGTEDDLTKEEKLKKSLKSFIEIKNQHTDTFGNYKHHFDYELVSKHICEINNVSYNDFSKLMDVVENGVELDYILTHDLDEFGLDEK